MRVQVLDQATGDLADGYRFYERQAEGLGALAAQREGEKTGRQIERRPPRHVQPLKKAV